MLFNAHYAQNYAGIIGASLAYINHFGGTHSWPMNALTVEMWKWCIDRQIFLMAEYLPGAENQVADMESRTVRDRCDWMLHPHFFTAREEDGPTRGGYVCISADTPAPSLLQLEARSGFRGNRCLYTELESVSWVCQSPMVSHISNIGKDSTGESLGDLGGANVEDTTMVSPPPSATVWLPSLDSNTGECSDFTNQGGVHHASGSASVGRLAIIRQQCRSGGLSEGASQLSASSWRSKTTSTYESLFKKWDSWCQERGRDPIRGPIADVLAELFEQGYQYRSLNSYRSAILSVLYIRRLMVWKLVSIPW